MSLHVHQCVEIFSFLKDNWLLSRLVPFSTLWGHGACWTNCGQLWGFGCGCSAIGGRAWSTLTTWPWSPRTAQQFTAYLWVPKTGHRRRGWWFGRMSSGRWSACENVSWVAPYAAFGSLGQIFGRFYNSDKIFQLFGRHVSSICVMYVSGTIWDLVRVIKSIDFCVSAFPPSMNFQAIFNWVTVLTCGW